jgi:hypothetical protein
MYVCMYIPAMLEMKTVCTSLFLLKSLQTPKLFPVQGKVGGSLSLLSRDPIHCVCMYTAERMF